MKTKMKFFSIFAVVAIMLSFAFSTLDRKIIVIDAGHGGIDFGASVENQTEKEIVAKIARKIQVLNLSSKVEIVLLRNADSKMDLAERAAEVSKINPDLLISLHVNTSTNAAKNGIEAYVYDKSNFYEQSLEIAKGLVKAISNENLSEGKIQNARFFILRKAECPAVILEIGYLSNTENREYISSDSGQSAVAGKILEFINK